MRCPSISSITRITPKCAPTASVRWKALCTTSGVAEVATSKSSGVRPSSRSRTQPPAKDAAWPSSRKRLAIASAARYSGLCRRGMVIRCATRDNVSPQRPACTMERVRDGLILGIETSCDETSAAVVRSGRDVLANVVASQLIHSDYGGVVPELASREHLRAIVPVVREAMQRAGVQYSDLDAVAVTEGPGLAGALLVGISFAKALAFGSSLPLIAVNHLEGHIHAVLMQLATPQSNDAAA